MIVLPSKLEGLRTQRTHRLCTLWRIARTDGVVFRFTDCNEQITFEGEDYWPTGGMDASARQKQEGLNTRNFEARGLINSDDITQSDLRAGKFREAEVTERLVDSRVPWAGALFMTKWWISELTYDGLMWSAQMQDRTRWLRMNVGDLIGRNCRFDLGDAHCKVNLASITVAGAVTGLTTQRLSFKTNLALSTDQYAYGKIAWLTGANAGTVSEIKKFEPGGILKRITLQLQTPYNIEVGDTFNATKGCPKTSDACKNIYGNFPNFGGYPHVPGTEQLLTTPNAS